MIDMQLRGVRKSDPTDSFVIHGLRFGSHPADGNVSIHFEKPQINVSICLTPQINLVPEFPQHLIFVVMVNAKRSLSDQEIDDVVANAAEIIGFDNLAPREQVEAGAPIRVAIVMKGRMGQSEEDKASGIFSEGAMICVPCDQKTWERNLMLVGLAGFTAKITEAHASKDASGATKH